MRSAVVSESDLIVGVLRTIAHRTLALMYDQPADNVDQTFPDDGVATAGKCRHYASTFTLLAVSTT